MKTALEDAENEISDALTGFRQCQLKYDPGLHSYLKHDMLDLIDVRFSFYSLQCLVSLSA